jgi:hypothetical protein
MLRFRRVYVTTVVLFLGPGTATTQIYRVSFHTKQKRQEPSRGMAAGLRRFTGQRGTELGESAHFRVWAMVRRTHSAACGYALGLWEERDHLERPDMVANACVYR